MASRPAAQRWRRARKIRGGRVQNLEELRSRNQAELKDLGGERETKRRCGEEEEVNRGEPRASLFPLIIEAGKWGSWVVT
jgi:hypothetical protein